MESQNDSRLFYADPTPASQPASQCLLHMRAVVVSLPRVKAVAVAVVVSVSSFKVSQVSRFKCFTLCFFVFVFCFLFDFLLRFYIFFSFFFFSYCRSVDSWALVMMMMLLSVVVVVKDHQRSRHVFEVTCVQQGGPLKLSFKVICYYCLYFFVFLLLLLFVIAFAN